MLTGFARLRMGETDRLVLRPPLPGAPSGDRFSEQRLAEVLRRSEGGDARGLDHKMIC